VVDEGLSAHQVAPKFGVPYTTVLEWSRKYRAGGEARLLPAAGRRQQQPSRALPARSAAIVAAKRADPRAGSRRIRDVLKRYFGLGTSATTVRRVLQQEGLATPRAKARAKPQPRVQRFERAEPNQLWQSDIFTFLLRKHERLYMAAFLDDHSRYLVSLALAHQQKSSLVLEALARGIADYGVPREILTDQGRQYTSWRGATEFEAELKRHGIRHLKSRPHHPQTCGKIERFWKTLWEELLSRTVFADFADCERRVRLFIQHYNFQRPHQVLDGQTPADRFFRAAAPVRAAIEQTVADNALRLAREQPPKLPFYLVGRLGDRDLAISARGADLTVRVGDEETTIPMRQEDDHDQYNTSARWQGGRAAAEAPVPSGAALAEARDGAGCDCAQPAAAAVVGAVRGDAGDHGDRAGQDLAGDVLQARVAGAAGDARGAEPAGRGVAGRALGPVGGERADRGAGGEGYGSRAGQAAGGALAAVDPQVAEGTGDDGPARAVAEAGAARRFDADVPWRELALIWERKLCGERAPSGRIPGEVADEPIAVDVHALAGSAGRGGAAPGGGAVGAVGAEDGERGGAGTGPVAQPVPEPDAPRAGSPGGAARGAAGGPAGEVAGVAAAADAEPEAAARERAPDAAGGDGRAAVGGNGRGVDGSRPDEPPATAPAQHVAEPP
jgi:transposase InsO family protein